MLLMKCQSVIVHAIYRIPVLPDMWITDTSFKMCLQEKMLVLALL